MFAIRVSAAPRATEPAGIFDAQPLILSRATRSASKRQARSAGLIPRGASLKMNTSAIGSAQARPVSIKLLSGEG